MLSASLNHSWLPSVVGILGSTTNCIQSGLWMSTQSRCRRPWLQWPRKSNQNLTTARTAAKQKLMESDGVLQSFALRTFEMQGLRKCRKFTKMQLHCRKQVAIPLHTQCSALMGCSVTWVLFVSI
eukprot:3456520-Amphidinium_carterae.1